MASSNKLIIESKVEKFIISLPPKHQSQLKAKILSLMTQPVPQDAKKLRGYEQYWRVDSGEYRIIYRYEVKDHTVVVVLAGRRNDNHVYRIARRILQ